MENIKRTIDILIKNEKYTVKFPTVGDYLGIERYKMSLSSGQYAQMVTSGLISGAEALDLIDMIAYFTILIPSLKDNLKVETFSELDLMDAKELVTVFKNDMKPWIDEWMKIFSTPSVKIKEKK